MIRNIAPDTDSALKNIVPITVRLRGEYKPKLTNSTTSQKTRMTMKVMGMAAPSDWATISQRSFPTSMLSWRAMVRSSFCLSLAGCNPRMRLWNSSPSAAESGASRDSLEPSTGQIFFRPSATMPRRRWRAGSASGP